jgi:hypothetical protein
MSTNPDRPTCLHCERRPQATGLGLCADCYAVRTIRLLYIRRRGWTPEWEAHLRRLTERARQQLPLFGPGLPFVPVRRSRPDETADDRLARLRRCVSFPQRSPDGD